MVGIYMASYAVRVQDRCLIAAGLADDRNDSSIYDSTACFMPGMLSADIIIAYYSLWLQDANLASLEEQNGNMVGPTYVAIANPSAPSFIVYDH